MKFFEKWYEALNQIIISIPLDRYYMLDSIAISSIVLP